MSNNNPCVYAVKLVAACSFQHLEDHINDFVETLDDYCCIDVQLTSLPLTALIFYKGPRPKKPKLKEIKEEICQQTEEKS
jgi:hypothetical protein